MARNEKPRFALQAYESTTKTELFLAIADLIAENAGRQAPELSDLEILAAIGYHADALRRAGWSTHVWRGE